MRFYTVVAELPKTHPNMPASSYLLEETLYHYEKFTSNNILGKRDFWKGGGLLPFAIWWHKKWRAPFSNEKRFNHVKYSGKVIIRKIMSSCLGVAAFCQTYNQ